MGPIGPILRLKRYLKNRKYYITNRGRYTSIGELKAFVLAGYQVFCSKTSQDLTSALKEDGMRVWVKTLRQGAPRALSALLIGLLMTASTLAGPGPQKEWSITLTGIGITVHGFNPGPGAAKVMKNKITESGRVAYNPQIGVILRKGYFQAGAIYLRDCYNHPAGLIGIGPNVKWGYVSFGSLLGIYGRQVPTETVLVYGATVTRPVDRLPLKKKAGSYEIAPLAMATVAIEIPIAEHISFEVDVALNGYLNHANGGFKIKW